MHGAEEIERGAVGHGRGDRDDLVVCGRKLGEAVGKDLRVGLLAEGLGLAGLGIVGSEAVELLLLFLRGLEAASLLRDRVQDDRAVQRLEELEGLDQLGRFVSVDGPVVLEPELLEEHPGPDHALGGLFGLARELRGGSCRQRFRPARWRVRSSRGYADW